MDEFYNHSGAGIRDPRDPPRELTEAEAIREELAEDPPRVEWMGLSLYVQSCHYLADGAVLFGHNDWRRITWRPDRERRMIESAAFAEIYHPQLGQQFHDRETVEGCQACAVDGIDPTAPGAFGNCLSLADFEAVAHLGWVEAQAKVRGRGRR